MEVSLVDVQEEKHALMRSSSGNTLALALALAFSSTASTGGVSRLGENFVRRKLLLFLFLSFIILAKN